MCVLGFVKFFSFQDQLNIDINMLCLPMFVVSIRIVVIKRGCCHPKGEVSLIQVLDEFFVIEVGG